MGRAQGIEGHLMNVMKSYLAGATALAGIMAVSPAFAQDLPSREELWKMIQQQQAQIEALQQKIDVTEKKVQETDKKVEATGSEVERIASSGGGSGGDGWWQKTSVGGYGGPSPFRAVHQS
jgi:septal ring factor EnvC (AmiA/AmiB activator)